MVCHSKGEKSSVRLCSLPPSLLPSSLLYREMRYGADKQTYSNLRRFDSYMYIPNVGNHLSSSITSFDRYVAIVLFGFRGLNTDIQHLDEQIYGLLVVSSV